MKVFGPYVREDGRKHVILCEDGQRTTQSYPRFLIEQFLGRKLSSLEEVDHIDGDFTNDSIENLRLLSKSENIRASKRTLFLDFSCLICGREFSIPERVYKHNQIVKGKSGPYCSKICAGVGSKLRRLGRI